MSEHSNHSARRRPKTGRRNGQLAFYLAKADKVRKKFLRAYRRKKWRLPHLALFPAVFVYYELLLRIFGGTDLFRNLIYPVLFGICAGGFAACLTSVFRPKVNRIISMVILYGVGLLFIMECLLKDSYRVYMTFGTITTGAGNIVDGFVHELMLAIFHGIPKIFLFWLPAILYTVTGRRRMPARRYRIAFVGILLVFTLILSGITVLIASHGKSAAKYRDQYDFHTATETFGLLTSLRLDMGYANRGGVPSGGFVLEDTPAEPDSAEDGEAPETAEPEPETAPAVKTENAMDIDFAALAAETSDEDLADMHNYVASLTPSKTNAYTGLFEGKNLILICAEAFSDAVVNEELTPTIYRLVHNGFYFSDFYQPTWGGSTSSGEYSFVMGIAPLTGAEAMQTSRFNNNYFTLGNQLQRLGYYSMCYHDGDCNAYNRVETHENLGYADYLANNNGLEELTGLFTGDKVMFDATMDTYIDKQPFSVYYMTVSGHSIYKENDARTRDYLEQVKAVYGGKYKNTTMYYLCYQLVLEDALTLMIEKLEAAGIADDTVIALTSDHYPYGLENTATFNNTEDYVTDLYGYKYHHSWEQDHNTLIIWSGCLEHENKDMACEISAPTYSLDVVPTLSNLFGLEYDSRLLMGRDVFSDAEPIAIWNNYSWVTEQGKYDSAEDKFYPNDGYTEDEDYIARIKTIVRNRLNFSGKVLSKDYYSILFGEDDITDNSHYVPKQTAAPVVKPGAAAGSGGISGDDSDAAGEDSDATREDGNTSDSEPDTSEQDGDGA